MKNSKPIRFFGEIRLMPDGSFKVASVQKLVSVNQYKRRWEQVPSREFARALNRGNLIIN